MAAGGLCRQKRLARASLCRDRPKEVTMKSAALAALIGFAALNVFAAVTAGLAGLGSAVLGVNAWSAVIVTDLAIALGMVSVWVYRDARRRGKSPAPYIALTLATGSLGPLLYLLVRGDDRV
jgi:hypothetical protein